MPQTHGKKTGTVTFVQLTVLVFFIFAFCFHAATSYSRRDARPQTAYDVFLCLPTSIFDNTTSPLSEEGKQRLLELGDSGLWTLVSKTADMISLQTRRGYYSEVTLLLFRSGLGGLAILNAKTSDSCTAELWSFNPHGGVLPFDGPPDPPPADFFSPERGFPEGVSPSYRLCLINNKLEAQPLFWDENGLSDIKPDNRIFFVWNGTAMQKEVLKIE